MHPLKKYLDEVSEPVSMFAARVGTSRQTLYRIFSGSHMPRPPLARRIVEATGGAVTFETLYGRRENRIDFKFAAPSRSDQEALDMGRLTIALAIMFNHISPNHHTSLPETVFSIAAAAAIKIHHALSSISSRSEGELLRQSLEPVIDEVRRAYLGAELRPSDIVKGSELVCELYFKPKSTRR